MGVVRQNMQPLKIVQEIAGGLENIEPLILGFSGLKGLYRGYIGIIGNILGLFWVNGKEDVNYYIV